MKLARLKISLEVNNSSVITHSPGQILTYQLILAASVDKIFRRYPRILCDKKAWLGLVPKQVVGNLTKRQANYLVL